VDRKGHDYILTLLDFYTFQFIRKMYPINQISIQHVGKIFIRAVFGSGDCGDGRMAGPPSPRVCGFPHLSNELNQEAEICTMPSLRCRDGTGRVTSSLCPRKLWPPRWTREST